jgi:putative protease
MTFAGNDIELLSPAGDAESVKAAVLYGADAVYVGGVSFGLRANAAFSAEGLADAVKYVHRYGKKIYLACNLVADNSDIDNLPEFIQIAANVGVDAVIVSDLGVFDTVKSCAPKMPVHISTQAGVMNYASANMLYNLGAKRIILARETSVEEIRRIRAETPPELEIEVFVHGAMCVSFSGRCLISSYLTARDANRGQCSQPCRWGYHLVEETRPGEFFPVCETKKGSYILNSKDLCMIEHIGELEECGITSFKIEGRAKTAYYSAVITNAYRVAIDSYKKGETVPEWVKREVGCVSHRPYCTGFYLKDVPVEQSYEFSGYVRECDFVGTVDGFSGGTVSVTQRNYFTVDDELEIIAPFVPPEPLVIDEMRNSDGEVVTAANHATEKLYIKVKGEKTFKAGSMLRRCNTQ